MRIIYFLSWHETHGFSAFLIRHWIFISILCQTFVCFCIVLSSGLQTMMPSQQPSYQNMMGVQQPTNPGLLNSQRTSIGGQMQSIMVQYPQMPSYQVSALLIRLFYVTLLEIMHTYRLLCFAIALIYICCRSGDILYFELN